MADVAASSGKPCMELPLNSSAASNDAKPVSSENVTSCPQIQVVKPSKLKPLPTSSPTSPLSFRTEEVLRRYADSGVEWWAHVQKRYGEVQRHYHTLTHIEHILELLKEVRDHFSDPESVELAAIFHDIVYDPWAKDNEENSAACFQTFAVDAELKPELTGRVVELIQATKEHLTDGHKAGCWGSDDVHYFLDMDMQVLGWPEEDYANYARQIREEYKHLSDEEYRKGRAAALKKIFASPHIYATKHFREIYEAQARANIVAEIKRLERSEC